MSRKMKQGVQKQLSEREKRDPRSVKRDRKEEPQLSLDDEKGSVKKRRRRADITREQPHVLREV